MDCQDLCRNRLVGRGEADDWFLIPVINFAGWLPMQNIVEANPSSLKRTQITRACGLGHLHL